MLAGGSGGGHGAKMLIAIYFLCTIYLSIWKAHYEGGPSSIVFFIYFYGSNKKQRSCDGWGGAQRPVWCGDKPKKTGAHSARAPTRGQNPLVFYINR